MREEHINNTAIMKAMNKPAAMNARYSDGSRTKGLMGEVTVVAVLLFTRVVVVVVVVGEVATSCRKEICIFLLQYEVLQAQFE